MPIVAAGFITNVPYFLPGTSVKFRDRLKNTNQALIKLAKIIKHHHPDIVVIISQTTTWDSNPLFFWQQSDYIAQFNTVGDLVTQKKFFGATGLTHSLKEFLEPKINVPLRSISQLPTEIALPLVYGQVDGLIASINLSTKLSIDTLLQIGKMMRDFFELRSEKIIILATGIPAYITSKNQRDYKIYLTNLRKILKTSNYSHLLQLEPSLRKAVREDCLRPLSLLYTLISDRAQTNILSDEDNGLIHQLVINITW